MSKLHDMKTKIGTAAIAATTKAAFGFSRKFVSTLGKMNKEEPEKVRAFLHDLATDKELPDEIRVACRNLLDTFNTGVPLEQAMRDNTETAIHKLETDLTEEYAGGKDHGK